MGSPRTLSTRWNNISISARLYWVAGIMAALIVCQLLTLQFAMSTLSAARAFVGGESLWSKAQKNAGFDIQRFGRSRDEKDFADFLAALSVPEGDHQARIELLKARPDLSVVRNGFLRGRNDPRDIDQMIQLLRRFSWIPPLTRAIQAWTRGDELLADFKRAGALYHAALLAGDTAAADEHLRRLVALNEALTLVEDEFSFTLGDATHWLEGIVLSLLSIGVLLVAGVGLTLTFQTSRWVSQSLHRLHETAAKIGKGDFTATTGIQSKDEIGQLAQSLEQMGQLLHHSYSELDQRVRERTLQLARSRDELKFLDEGSQLMTSSLTVQDTPKKLIELAVPRVADWCGIELDPDANGYKAFAFFQSEPGQPTWVQAMRDRRELAMRAGESGLYPQEASLRVVGIHSAMVVPLKARGKTFGTVTLITSASGREYSRECLRLAEGLAGRAGIAIDNAALYVQAREAVRLREDFLSMAAHELRTPLSSLGLQVQSAQRDGLSGMSPPALSKLFGVLSRQIRRMTRLIDDMMDVSRVQAGRLTLKLQTTDLSELARGLVSRFSDELVRTGTPVSLDVPDGVKGVLDEGRIEQVMDNLVSNAIKYAPGRPLRISLSTSGDLATLIVADEGPGIPQEAQARIFERFERATHAGPDGLGLGLYIVREIVKAHGGFIQVLSEPGKGARFVVTLPLTRPLPEAASVHP
jgi:signal transduction histidine kinase/HAMP domain-containing protein